MHDHRTRTNRPTFVPLARLHLGEVIANPDGTFYKVVCAHRLIVNMVCRDCGTRLTSEDIQ